MQSGAGEIPITPPEEKANVLLVGQFLCVFSGDAYKSTKKKRKSVLKREAGWLKKSFKSVFFIFVTHTIISGASFIRITSA